jgi:hypothetical protein
MKSQNRKTNGEIRKRCGAGALTPVDTSLPDASRCIAENELNEQTQISGRQGISPRSARRTRRKRLNHGLVGYRGSENALICGRAHPRDPRSILFLLRALRDLRGESKLDTEKPGTKPLFGASRDQHVSCAKTKANTLALDEPIMRNGLHAQELA